jgi:hypothetical protein
MARSCEVNAALPVTDAIIRVEDRISLFALFYGAQDLTSFAYNNKLIA